MDYEDLIEDDKDETQLDSSYINKNSIYISLSSIKNILFYF